MTSATERKRQQRIRDRKDGLVRLERRVKPEWVTEIDKLIARLEKKAR